MDSIGLLDVDHLKVSRFQAQAKGRKSQETNSLSLEMDLQYSAPMSSRDLIPVSTGSSQPTFGGSGTGTRTVSGTATLAIAKMTREGSSVSNTGTSTWWKYGWCSWILDISWYRNMNFHGSSSCFLEKLPHSEPPHMLHHGGSRHVHMHILWRAWHVVGVVDGLHNLAIAIDQQSKSNMSHLKMIWYPTMTISIREMENHNKANRSFEVHFRQAMWIPLNIKDYCTSNQSGASDLLTNNVSKNLKCMPYYFDIWWPSEKIISIACGDKNKQSSIDSIVTSSIWWHMAESAQNKGDKKCSQGAGAWVGIGSGTGTRTGLGRI